MEFKDLKQDARQSNKRGGPSHFRKMRVIVGQKLNPVAYGVTLPTEIAMQFSGCQLRIRTSGTSIILESGGRL